LNDLHEISELDEKGNREISIILPFLLKKGLVCEKVYNGIEVLQDFVGSK